MTGSFTLSKNERLKRRKSIEMLFDKGKAIKYPAIILIHRKSEDKEGLKAMFTVSKRNYKRAHDRNRIKRLMREAYRLQRNLITLEDKNYHLCFTFTGKQLPEYAYVYEKMGLLLNNLNAQLKELP